MSSWLDEYYGFVDEQRDLEMHYACTVCKEPTNSPGRCWACWDEFQANSEALDSLLSDSGYLGSDSEIQAQEPPKAAEFDPKGEGSET